MKLATGDDNTDLMRILTKEREGAFFSKNTSVEVLKKYYQYTVIKFYCISSTGAWSPEKCFTEMLSSNLLVVGVLVEKNNC